MLTRSHRFNQSYQVRYVLRKGQTVKSGPFACKYVRNDRPHPAKVAVIVSKKVEKSAVGRNRMRRRVFEALRPRITSFQGISMTITVYSNSVMTMSVDELNSHLDVMQKQLTTS